MASATKEQQVKAVVEGLALGTLALDVEAVSGGKVSLEFAVSHALRRWSYADTFPSLSGHQGANYVWGGMRKSERRKQVYAAWADGQWLEPYIICDEWSVEDCTEVLAETGSVPHDGWVELARLFIERLGEDNVRRVEQMG